MINASHLIDPLSKDPLVLDKNKQTETKPLKEELIFSTNLLAKKSLEEIISDLNFFSASDLKQFFTSNLEDDLSSNKLLLFYLYGGKVLGYACFKPATEDRLFSANIEPFMNTPANDKFYEGVPELDKIIIPKLPDAADMLYKEARLLHGVIKVQKALKVRYLKMSEQVFFNIPLGLVASILKERGFFYHKYSTKLWKLKFFKRTDERDSFEKVEVRIKEAIYPDQICQETKEYLIDRKVNRVEKRERLVFFPCSKLCSVLPLKFLGKENHSMLCASQIDKNKLNEAINKICSGPNIQPVFVSPSFVYLRKKRKRFKKIQKIIGFISLVGAYVSYLEVDKSIKNSLEIKKSLLRYTIQKYKEGLYRELTAVDTEKNIPFYIEVANIANVGLQTKKRSLSLASFDSQEKSYDITFLLDSTFFKKQTQASPSYSNFV